MLVKHSVILIPGLGGEWEYTHSYQEIDNKFKQVNRSEEWVKKQRSAAFNAAHHHVTDDFIQYIKRDQNKFYLISIQIL